MIENKCEFGFGNCKNPIGGLLVRKERHPELNYDDYFPVCSDHYHALSVKAKNKEKFFVWLARE